MFKGSYVALITPFRNGSVGETEFQSLVDWQIKQGTDGLVPCGTTGESPTLSHDEHEELRLAAITTMAEANAFLREIYLPRHNARFAVPAEAEGSAFVPFTGSLDDILCIQEDRIVGNDNTVRYKRLVLQIPEDRHRRQYVKASVRVHEYSGGTLAVFHGPRRLARYQADGTILDETKNSRAAA